MLSGVHGHPIPVVLLVAGIEVDLTTRLRQRAGLDPSHMVLMKDLRGGEHKTKDPHGAVKVEVEVEVEVHGKMLETIMVLVLPKPPGERTEIPIVSSLDPKAGMHQRLLMEEEKGRHGARTKWVIQKVQMMTREDGRNPKQNPGARKWRTLEQIVTGVMRAIPWEGGRNLRGAHPGVRKRRILE